MKTTLILWRKRHQPRCLGFICSCSTPLYEYSSPNEIMAEFAQDVEGFRIAFEAFQAHPPTGEETRVKSNNS